MDEPTELRIGIDLGGTKIEGVAVDRSGRVVERRRVPTPREDYAGSLDAVGELVATLERASGARSTVGIGTPGAISPATGKVKNANSTWLNGRRLLQDLERRLERSLRMANDADCFALSEAVDGAAAGASPVFGAILGTGVGGGIVIDGRLLQGAQAIAGEWGHNPLPWPTDEERPGRPCYCGRSGCIETFLSGPGLAADYAGTGTAAEIATLARAGDREAQACVERYAERLGRALATVINLIDPEVIVLGGGLSGIDRLYEQVPAGWSRWVFSDRVETRLLPPRHGDASGALGAARLWE